MLQEVLCGCGGTAPYDGGAPAAGGAGARPGTRFEVLRSTVRAGGEEGVQRDRPTAHEPVPLEDLEERERQRRLRAALVTLPEEQRRCIELAFFTGLSHSEIAARLQQPLGTVKSRIQLGMAKLRAALRGCGDGRGGLSRFPRRGWNTAAPSR